MSQFKLELGKYYKNRVGVVFGPMIESNDGLYPFEDDGESETWSKSGRYYSGEYNDMDLVEEVANPAGDPILLPNEVINDVKEFVALAVKVVAISDPTTKDVIDRILSVAKTLKEDANA